MRWKFSTETFNPNFINEVIRILFDALETKGIAASLKMKIYQDKRKKQALTFDFQMTSKIKSLTKKGERRYFQLTKFDNSKYVFIISEIYHAVPSILDLKIQTKGFLLFLQVNVHEKHHQCA